MLAVSYDGCGKVKEYTQFLNNKQKRANGKSTYFVEFFIPF